MERGAGLRYVLMRRQRPISTRACRPAFGLDDGLVGVAQLGPLEQRLMRVELVGALRDDTERPGNYESDHHWYYSERDHEPHPQRHKHSYRHRVVDAEGLLEGRSRGDPNARH